METESDALVSLKLLTRNKHLVEARKAKGMAQVAFSKAVGIGFQKYADIENLKRSPTVGDQSKISSYLGLFPDDLFPAALLEAIEADVFGHRDATLDTPQIISLTEAQHLQLVYQDEEMDDIDGRLLAERIGTALDSLPPRQREVIRHRFGFDGRAKTLKETGRYLGLTAEGVRKIETKVLRKLRHPTISRNLEDFV